MILEWSFNESPFPQIELKQILIYCDPYMAEMENCCEILEPKVKSCNVAVQYYSTNTYCLL